MSDTHTVLPICADLLKQEQGGKIPARGCQTGNDKAAAAVRRWRSPVRQTPILEFNLRSGIPQTLSPKSLNPNPSFGSARKRGPRLGARPSAHHIKGCPLISDTPTQSAGPTPLTRTPVTHNPKGARIWPAHLHPDPTPLPSQGLEGPRTPHSGKCMHRAQCYPGPAHLTGGPVPPSSPPNPAP